MLKGKRRWRISAIEPQVERSRLSPDHQWYLTEGLKDLEDFGKLAAKLNKQKIKPMTVKQAIAFLSKIKNKNMAMMIDCPYCGKGNQLELIHEVILLRTKESE